ncbi:phosphoesterase [Sulfodiicoccus acidiphilus]|uniref:Phosphoesterase n=1 Tax=Sulfodiicoccus acidiphilus TaxID=1670455 RepID=A0A348B3C3_9CREN|nr:CehA/McbA family metallohydrolase [Sulfodiicoccus acidiphilus]BBD72675.1 phosphoesterase [Sulfodiicoccus acidiphilus]GGT95569.1 phosphoesterase [Sulfodiicoccus acidiphilus]
MSSPLKLDLHVHTYYSDGKESPEEMMRAARRAGLHMIAVTDHDTFDGAKTVAGRIVMGMEVTTQYGHVVVLCSEPMPLPKLLPDLLDASKDQNCLAFPSHPFDVTRAGLGERIHHFKFDAVEVFNSKAPRSANQRALEVSRTLSLPGLANSDSHVKSALGSAYNLVYADSTKPEDILEAIRKGMVTPVGIGLGVKAKLEIVEWYVQRKIAHNFRRPMRQM